ncbi:MAG: hypothetical protein FJ301_01835 [Planctomycetes bacterium]|nr:hypothetical protein [Planctomycetota bacterium]
MIRVTPTRLLSLLSVAFVAACSGGDDGAGVGTSTGGTFLVLSTEPSNNATLFLNDAIRIDFSNPINFDSVNLSTFAFEVQDQLGNIIAEPVAGEFSVGTSPGDTAPGRRLLFNPRLPSNDLYTNGGFRPGRTYVVQLVGGSIVNGTTLSDQRGRPLAQPVTFRFTTSNGTTAAQLFRNTLPGGPRKSQLLVTPVTDTSGAISLNKLGSSGVEVRLQFDQPLNPSSLNVPVAIPTDPLTRSPNNRGRVFLEYDDPIYGENIWLPADAELASNTTSGATITLRPLGVLPNNALVRVVVENTLEDISGESNVANAAYDRIFGQFRTRRAYDQQFDAVVQDFLAAEQIDLAAAFPEPTAQVGPGYIKAGFDFEGAVTGAEFEPTVPQTILNTNFTVVTPKEGAPFNVAGGVFNFKNVKIPAGKVVLGTGTNPMVFLVTGSFEVAGTLSVRGFDGVRVTTTANANVPKAGGAGACGGGDGGAGSPSTTLRDLFGAPGNGPNQAPGQGGVGGTLSCIAGCNRGAGGGGGGLTTQGDPNFKQKTQPPTATAPFPVFQQQNGIGGNGCFGAGGSVTRSLPGSVAGVTVFADARSDNNFFGVGIRFDGTPQRIPGELAAPIGGGGGGGGGDVSSSTCDENDVNFETDLSGGGGGGGGGVLIVKALGPIIVADGGKIVADGGSGGDGEAVGSVATSRRGGGGGAGAGGMVILMSATRIDINARGNNGRFLYGAASGVDTNDFDFSISADGGACVTAGTYSPTVLRKYQTDTTGVIPAAFATLYDSAPLGGFGGMGIVQLMAPPGSNTDGTNTRLDDNINFFRASVLQSGAGKRNLIAWRGFPNSLGQGVDDSGTVVTIGDNEGDIRPSPILLPAPFGAKTRLRSRWIDTGSVVRRGILSDDNLPRGVIESGGAQRGPRYEFAGVSDFDGVIQTSTTNVGFASFRRQGSVALAKFPEIVPLSSVLSQPVATTYQGDAAYVIDFATVAIGLGATPDRYTGYIVELFNAANARLEGFRILSHTDRQLIVSSDGRAMPAAVAKARVLAAFYEMITNGVRGQGPTYLGANGLRVPNANVKIGFAFHQDPASLTALRFPANPNDYLYNLEDAAVQQQIRALGAAFVQWDILFDIGFKESTGDVPPNLSPSTPRPELRFLSVPFRF